MSHIENLNVELLAFPNLKYNCAILFLKEMHWLIIYASIIFFIDHYCKT